MRGACLGWLLVAGCGGPITATPIPVGTAPFGALTPIAAVSLSGPGGWSGAALVRTGDARALWVVSDRGDWARLDLALDGDGALVGVTEGARGALTDRGGAPVAGKDQADAEALVATPDGWQVAFERDHRIWTYGDAGPVRLGPHGPAGTFALPASLVAPDNGGIEALAAFSGGVALVVEGADGAEGPHPGWWGTPARWAPFQVARTGALRPVELTPLGEDLLLLERSWSVADGVAVRVSRLPGEAVRGGGVVTPEAWATLRPGAVGVPVDNFEAAAVDGDTLWLLSDDNQSPTQRTLLVQLRWRAPDPVVRGARVVRYPLAGADAGALLRACRADCPTDAAGRRVRGRTTWSLQWTWDPVPDGAGGCRPAHPRATVAVTVDLPDWTPPRGADPALVTAYPAYLAALARHEQAHVDRVHAAARAGEIALATLPCDAAPAAARGWLAALDAEQAALDQETASGTAEAGGAWP